MATVAKIGTAVWPRAAPILATKADSASAVITSKAPMATDTGVAANLSMAIVAAVVASPLPIGQGAQYAIRSWSVRWTRGGRG
jgi:hypothetical protein